MSPKRQNISSGSPWEPKVGFSRAVRIGNLIAVAGTMATDEVGQPVGDTAYDQTVVCLRKIGDALGQAGATYKHVYRTRMYLTSIEDQEQVSRAHAEIFGDIRPAATMVEVTALAGKGFLVEVEADALLLDD
jgi:enamine deaminase RidA (YjgF/YER057c/UK114 family)